MGRGPKTFILSLKINSKTKLGMTMICIVVGSSDLASVIICVMKIMGKETSYMRAGKLCGKLLQFKLTFAVSQNLKTY